MTSPSYFIYAIITQNGFAGCCVLSAPYSLDYFTVLSGDSILQLPILKIFKVFPVRTWNAFSLSLFPA